MRWNDINKVLPKDKEEIIIYHEGLKKEFKRTFYIEFWQKHNRVTYCDEFCRKWKSIQ